MRDLFLVVHRLCISILENNVCADSAVCSSLHFALRDAVDQRDEERYRLFTEAGPPPSFTKMPKKERKRKQPGKERFKTAI